MGGLWLCVVALQLLPVPALAAGVPALPEPPKAWKSTFASADPAAAQAFAVEYLGARAIPQPHRGGNGTCALIKWVDFPHSCMANGTDCFELHFVNLWSHRVGNFTLEDWRDYMQALDGNISWSGVHKYNQFMDNHIGVRFADAVPFIDRFKRDSIPYFTRRQSMKDAGCDIFVQIPNNGIIFELRSEHCCDSVSSCAIELQNWDLCRYTNGTGSGDRWGATQLASVPPAPTPRPAIVPWKMTYASTDPEAAANFSVLALGARHIAAGVHLGNCTGPSVRWVEFGEQGGFQLHFVNNPRKADAAPGLKRMSLRELELYLTAEHGDLRRANGPEGNADYDIFMDNHVGILVDDVAPFVSRLDALGIPFFLRGSNAEIQDVFVELPGGIMFEISHKGEAATPVPGLTPWDLCQNATSARAGPAWLA